MSLKDLTLEQLRAERPDLVQAVEGAATLASAEKHKTALEAAVGSAAAKGKIEGLAEGTAEGVKTERGRCTAIIDAADKCRLQDTANPLLVKLITDGADPQAALLALQAEKIRQLSVASPPPIGPAPPDAGPEKKPDTSTPEGHLAAAQAYQKEKGGTLAAALSATAPKRS